MNKIFMLPVLFVAAVVFGAEPNLKMQLLFQPVAGTDSIRDVSGNNYNAQLKGTASLVAVGDFYAVSSGNGDGYVDLGANTGNLISTLTDFTISAYLYVHPSQDLSANGNFAWTFSNSANILTSATGCMFYSAKSSRYAISKTNWTGEKGVNLNTQSSKGVWVHVLYKQQAGTGYIYHDGILKKSGAVSISPAEMGNPAFNYLFKSPYGGDKILRNSMIHDFRIYNIALSDNQIVDLSGKLNVLNETMYGPMIDEAMNNLVISPSDSIKSNLYLPVSDINDIKISWQSSNELLINNTGEVFRPAVGSQPAKVKLTATFSIASTFKTKEFDFWVIPFLTDSESVAVKDAYAGYLFAYFTGNSIDQEAIRFALSSDGLAYKALNGNQPIIASSTISSTGGVRDPHIYRGQNGEFLMVVTDMVSAWGWNSNRGLVLLKSTDLINWSSSAIHIPTAFPDQFADVDRVWAPQVIWDQTVQKYMVYFSMRKVSADYDKIYYTYANESFTALTTVPEQLFYNPAQTACIDGDIVEKDGKFHLFFKTEGSGNGIKRAVSSNLSSGYVLYDKYLQQTTQAVEGSCVFRIYNTDLWILMYDVYTSGYYQFAKTFDFINFSVINSGVSMDFTPRHGTIIPVTADEIQRLRVKWDPTLQADAVKHITNAETVSFEIFDFSGKLIKKAKYDDVANITSDLKEGLYLVKNIFRDNSFETTKIMITHR